MAGSAAILSWALGAVMIVFVAINYSELGVMFPVAGGVVRYPHYAFGSFASYTNGRITWLSAAGTVGIEVLATVQCASSYLPWLMETKDGVLVLTGPRSLVSVPTVLVFYIFKHVRRQVLCELQQRDGLVEKLLLLIVVVVLALLAFNRATSMRPSLAVSSQTDSRRFSHRSLPPTSCSPTWASARTWNTQVRPKTLIKTFPSP